MVSHRLCALRLPALFQLLNAIHALNISAGEKLGVLQELWFSGLGLGLGLALNRCCDGP